MSEAQPGADHQLDVTGLWCPEPVMLLHRKIREMAAGEIVMILATDPATERDIPRFCQFLGHDLLAREASAGEYRYWLRKQVEAR